jgi:hypothetical protein
MSSDQQPKRSGRRWVSAAVAALVLVALAASVYGCSLPERSPARDHTTYVAFAAAAGAAGAAVVFNRTGRNR